MSLLVTKIYFSDTLSGVISVGNSAFRSVARRNNSRGFIPSCCLVLAELPLTWRTEANGSWSVSVQMPLEWFQWYFSTVWPSLSYWNSSAWSHWSSWGAKFGSPTISQIIILVLLLPVDSRMLLLLIGHLTDGSWALMTNGLRWMSATNGIKDLNLT